MTTIVIAWVCYIAVLLINKSKFIYSLEKEKATPYSLKIGFITLLLFTIFFPKDLFNQSFSASRAISTEIGKGHPIEIFEGRTSLTPIYFNQKQPFWLPIRPFGLKASGALLDNKHIGISYYSLTVPQALDHTFRPKKILELGLGTGGFPYVIKELPFVEKVVVVELNPEVIKAFTKYSYPEITAMFQHPKVELNIMDARRYVQKALGKGEKFDVIQIGVQTDRKGSAGVSNLYSYEFFKNLTKLLSEDGMLIIEPYIGVVRVAFEFFEYGYTIDGASWVFMRNKPFPNAGNIMVGSYIMNLSSVTDIRQISNINLPNKPMQAHHVVEFNRQDIIQYFPNMMCTDYNPIFEYHYISSLFKNYVRPTNLVYETDYIKQKK